MFLASIPNIFLCGCKRSGRPRDGPLGHSTGRGYVAERRGDYHDAIVNKKNMVILVHVEPLGGIAPETMREIYRLGERCKGGGVRDRTKYGHTRAGPKHYFNFHVQALSIHGSAVKSNSNAILMQFNRCNQEASACLSSGGAKRRLARPQALSDPLGVAAVVAIDRLRVRQVFAVLLTLTSIWYWYLFL